MACYLDFHFLFILLSHTVLWMSNLVVQRKLKKDRVLKASYLDFLEVLEVI